jgi:hypothetical protein
VSVITLLINQKRSKEAALECIFPLRKISKTKSDFAGKLPFHIKSRDIELFQGNSPKLSLDPLFES